MLQVLGFVVQPLPLESSAGYENKSILYRLTAKYTHIEFHALIHFILDQFLVVYELCCVRSRSTNVFDMVIVV